MWRNAAPVKWGWPQVFWLLLGFMLAQLAGAAGCTALSMVVAHGYMALTRQAPAGGGYSLLAGVLAGYLTSVLWSLWYIGRLGAARISDGSPVGIGWRAAPPHAYAVAMLCAAGIILLVFALVAAFPPDVKALEKLPSAKLFDTNGLGAVLLAGLVVFIAPPVEEFVFRGGVFAALAGKFGTVWAGVLTTILFMAVHAPEKIHYPPGFIDVGLMAAAAAWLRVRYQSIRPGILLHVLYNAGLLLASGLMG